MSSLLQLLVVVGVAVAGAIIALRIDRIEHSDARQHQIHFPDHKNDLGQRGVAMSRLR
jgi:hypothetical protein